ncbi:NXNL1 protein, partial [Polypterus senegalus]
MVELFHGKVLIRNNKDRDEVDTERELSLQLQNKVLLLFFGAADCPQCQAFAPKLKDFFVHLTDEFYVERASQLVLVYVSRDQTEDKQDKFLRDMPKRWLALPFEDHFKRWVHGGDGRAYSARQESTLGRWASLHRSAVHLSLNSPLRLGFMPSLYDGSVGAGWALGIRGGAERLCGDGAAAHCCRGDSRLVFFDHRDLEDMFKVTVTPTVVVLRPDGSVISPNAVDEICDLGVACFKNWQEAADLIDRSFMLAEDFDELPMRSATEPLRRLRYKVDKKKKMNRVEEEEEDEEEDGDVWG